MLWLCFDELWDRGRGGFGDGFSSFFHIIGVVTGESVMWDKYLLVV